MNTDSNYKIIAFDFFGVICSEVAPFWFVQHFPKESAPILKEKYVHPADTGEISGSEMFSELGDAANLTPEKVRDEWSSLAKIDQGVVSLIRVVKNKFKIVLCSNSSSDFLHQVLKDNNLEDLFDDIIVSSEIGYAKPDRLFFDKTLERLGASPSELLFIDDNAENIAAAKNLGIKSLLFKSAKELEFLKS